MINSIADGIMRAKKIQFFVFDSSGPNDYECLENLSYNLAFSRALSVLKLCSNASYPGIVKPTIMQNLSKLLSISASIEYINISRLPLAKDSNLDFFKALAQNVSLKYLDISGTNTTEDGVKNLAHSLAINAENKGSLRHLISNAMGVNKKYVYQFIREIWTSAQKHEEWFGEKTKANQMGGADRKRKYNCNLETLSLDSYLVPCIKFNQERYKKKIKDALPGWIYIFAHCPNLKKLSLRYNGIN